MPGRDGSGPRGRGMTSGRGLGSCHGAKAVCGKTGLGPGLRSRRCLGTFGADPKESKTQKELLQEQKELLENKLNSISKQLQSL